MIWKGEGHLRPFPHPYPYPYPAGVERSRCSATMEAGITLPQQSLRAVSARLDLVAVSGWQVGHGNGYGHGYG